MIRECEDCSHQFNAFYFDDYYDICPLCGGNASAIDSWPDFWGVRFGTVLACVGEAANYLSCVVCGHLGDGRLGALEAVHDCVAGYCGEEETP